MYILGSLEITDYEVRLLVGEFNDSRFNMLHLECAKCDGVLHRKITNPKAVQNAIRHVLDETYRKLGYHIKRVILVIPPVNFRKHTHRVNVYIGDQKISKDHIHEGIKKLIQGKSFTDLQFVNLSSIKFTTNGIVSRKMPLAEKSEILSIEADLLFASQETVFDYVGLVEKTGLDVLDICLESIAFGEEAAIFEQSMDRYIIGVGVERQTTTLSLYHKGSLMSTELIHEGFERWAEIVRHEYGFSMNECYHLLENIYTLKERDMKESIIHLWNEEQTTRYLSEKELGSTIAPMAQKWISKIKEMSEPIFEQGDVKFVFGGSGAQMVALQSLLPNLGCEATIFIPQTLGARNPALIHTLGAFYAYQSPLNTRRSDLPSANIADVKATLARQENGYDEGTFTKKLKKIFNS